MSTACRFKRLQRDALPLREWQQLGISPPNNSGHEAPFGTTSERVQHRKGSTVNECRLQGNDTLGDVLIYETVA